jgi:hypothetical protein
LPDYLPPLNNFVIRDFLIFPRFSVSFIRVFNPFFINNLNSFRIFSRFKFFFYDIIVCKDLKDLKRLLILLIRGRLIRFDLSIPINPIILRLIVMRTRSKK